MIGMDNQPPGAPEPRQVKAQWETNTHFIYQLKASGRRIAIAKKEAKIILDEVVPQRIEGLGTEFLSKIQDRFVEAWKDREKKGLPEGLSPEDFLNRAHYLREELLSRGETVNPGLPTLPHNLDESRCSKLLESLPEEVAITEDYVRFGGEWLTEAEGQAGTVEIVLHDGARDSSRDLKLYRIVKAVTGRDVQFTLAPDEWPERELLEGYDLVLRRIGRSARPELINEPQYQARVYCSAPTVGFIEDLQERRRTISDGLVDTVVVPNFVSVSGSFLYHSPDRKPNDVDVIVKSSWRADVEEQLAPLMEAATGLDVHWVWEPRSPNWTWLGLYDLVLKARRPDPLKEGHISKPQNCHYCKEAAVKALIWADGRAYVPVCERHEPGARRDIEHRNKDKVLAVRPIPQRVQEQAREGGHPHPHGPDGRHSHPGLPLRTGQHGHQGPDPSGAHRHRPGDPLEGGHSNAQGDPGYHEHPKALQP